MMASAGALPGVKAADEANASTQLAAAAPLPAPQTAVATVDARPRSGEQERSGKQDRAVLVAMQEPAAARFGASDFDTAQPKSIPFQTAAADGEQPTLGFQSTPDDTNAIAAMIMSENGLTQ